VAGVKSVVPLAPAGKTALPEDDIVSLAKRAPGAAADAQFALKAFYLYVLADKNREAKDWLDKLTTPKARIGTERYADRFKGMTSAREEAKPRPLRSAGTFSPSQARTSWRKLSCSCVKSKSIALLVLTPPLPSGERAG
jgi:hypothetical protein